MPMAHSFPKNVASVGAKREGVTPRSSVEKSPVTPSVAPPVTRRKSLSSRPSTSGGTSSSASALPRPFTRNKSDAEIVVEPATPPAPPGRKITVAVRKRPLNQKEISRKESDICQVTTQSSLKIFEPKVKVDLTKYTEEHVYSFDEVFDDASNNREIYERTIQNLVEFIFYKGKATCFAFGQTGSGKTFTMMGNPQFGQEGLFSLAGKDIFGLLEGRFAHLNLEVYSSFFEIYGGELFDLLNCRTRLVAREDAGRNVVVVGLQEVRLRGLEDLLALMDHGLKTRSVGSTGANEDSSRSHAVLNIVLKGNDGKRMHGKLSFIDLAGSERGADTSNNARGTRLEGAEINKSLLALKECIRALDMASRHLPFRGSKLTQVLKESFIGNSRTVMITNISPSSTSCEHTLNTLRYADRVKQLRRDDRSPTSLSEANISARGGGAGDQTPSDCSDGMLSQDELPLSEGELDDYQGDEALNDSLLDPDISSSDTAKHLSALHLQQPTQKQKQKPPPPEDTVASGGGTDTSIVRFFRSYVDETIGLFEQEVALLNAMETGSGDLAQQLNDLDGALCTKIDMAMDLRNHLHSFRSSQG